MQCPEGDLSPRLSFRRRLVNSILGISPSPPPLSPSESRNVSPSSTITRLKSRSVRLSSTANAERTRHPRPLSWGCVCTSELLFAFQSSSFLCHILSLHLVHALRVEVAFKISHITQNLVELCLELNKSEFYSFMLLFSFV